MRYGNHEALDGIDLDVAAGEVVGVLGPNGAGKTSFLRLLCGGRRPTSGSIAIPTRRADIGIAGDESIHLDALSGLENALIFAELGGLTRASARPRVRALLTRFGLDADAHRPVADYSFGMRRKLLLLEALAHEPRLVVMDEPTTGLDQQGRDALHQLLRERVAAGAAVVLASNDPLEPQRLCDRVLFLHRGRIVLEGSPKGLIERLGGAERLELKRPDLADVFRAATGEVLQPQ